MGADNDNGRERRAGNRIGGSAQQRQRVGRMDQHQPLGRYTKSRQPRSIRASIRAGIGARIRTRIHGPENGALAPDTAGKQQRQRQRGGSIVGRGCVEFVERCLGQIFNCQGRAAHGGKGFGPGL